MARLRGFLAILVACYLWGGVSLNAGAGTPQAGFAIWPEDNAEAATTACSGRGQDEAWRTTPEETAEQFAAEELGWTAPSAAEPWELNGQSRLIVYDNDARGVFLGVVLDLIPYDDCWYITEAFPREGDVGSTIGFTEVEGETYFLFRLSAWDGMWLDYGFGDEHDQPIQGGDQLLFPVEGETDMGHQFVYEEDQPSDNVRGGTLPAPMDPSTAEPASPRGGFAMWPFHEVGRYSGVDRCKRDWMHVPKRAAKTFVRYIGKPSVLERQDRTHWIAEVEDARFQVILRRVRKDCWPVRRVVSLDREIGATIRPADDGYTVDLVWGDAATANLTLNYGGNWDGAYLERLSGPFTEPQIYDFGQQGAYWIVLRDAEGRILGVEGSQLGPID